MLQYLKLLLERTGIVTINKLFSRIIILFFLYFLKKRSTMLGYLFVFIYYNGIRLKLFWKFKTWFLIKRNVIISLYFIFVAIDNNIEL
jgi:ABC-type transporter Mla maintaining outer membrane lipid asymmetry permease subunit MlaE